MRALRRSAGFLSDPAAGASPFWESPAHAGFQRLRQVCLGLKQLHQTCQTVKILFSLAVMSAVERPCALTGITPTDPLFQIRVFQMRRNLAAAKCGKERYAGHGIHRSIGLAKGLCRSGADAEPTLLGA